MYFKIRQLRLKHLLVMMFALTSVIMAVTVSAKVWKRAESTTEPNRNAAVTKALAGPGGKPNLVLLPIQIREAGFARRELTGEAGNYELLIINASRQPGLTLKLQREHSEELQSFPTQRSKNTRKQFPLGPGVYVLSVVEHPDWFCRLTITKS